jgi:hypothetical protein
MSDDYQRVNEALQSGADPAMLCELCPWDRLCVTPPTMTKQEIDAKMNQAKIEDEQIRREAELPRPTSRNARRHAHDCRHLRRPRPNRTPLPRLRNATPVVRRTANR